MKSNPKPFGYWTASRIQLEARKYKTRRAFAVGSPGAYDAAFNLKKLNLFCKHMPKNASKKHTVKNALKVSKQYSNKTELRFYRNDIYKYLYKKNMLNKAFPKPKTLGSRYYRFVYVILFSKKYAYVGLTYDLKRRIKDHKQSRLSSYFKKHKFQIKSSKLLHVFEAVKLEDLWIKKYSKSYVILNKAKAGGIGGIIRIWTKEKVKQLSSKEKYRSVFSKKYPSAYAAALNNGYWEEISKHMPMRSTPRYGKFNSRFRKL